MKHIVFTIVFVFGLAAQLFAADQKYDKRLQDVEENVATLQESHQAVGSQVMLLREKTEAITEMVNTSNGFIANQISASEWLVGIIALVMGLAGIGLGIYIGRMHNLRANGLM